MKAIPVPVRERRRHLYDLGKSTCEIAISLGSCVADVRRVRQHFNARGTLEPQTHRCGRKTLLTARRRGRRQRLMTRRPDATLAELGARLEYLPPCSPDFNPIENLWSKVKQGLERREPRTARPLFTAAGAALAPSPLKTAAVTFYMPDTLYALCKCSNVLGFQVPSPHGRTR